MPQSILKVLSLKGLSAAAALTWLAGSAHAHHAFAAEFDVNRPLTLEGTVVRVEWVNPHSWFHLRVDGADGEEPVVWMVEGGSPNALIRRGVTQQSVPAGMRLVVEGYQARNGTATAVGRSFLLENGQRLFLGGSAEQIDAPAQ
jgi:hypothetical protein